MVLAWIAGVRPQADLDPRHAPATQSQPGGATPIAPPTSGGVLDTLKKVDEQQASRRRRARRRRVRNKAGWLCRTASTVLHQNFPSML